MSAKRRSSHYAEIEEVDEDASAEDNSSDDDDGDDDGIEVTFTQQAPEQSQCILPVKPAEKRNLDNMCRDARDKAVTDLSRLLLFKALAGEPIDRLKCVKEALTSNNNSSSYGSSDEKIASAALEESSARLREVFGFELKRVPKYMEDNYKNFPSKFKDRMYVINELEDENSGTHSKAIHGVHADSAIQKGLLMVVLAFCFCKGEPRSDGSRWITDHDLYRLLNGLDENIPAEPPVKKSAGGTGMRVGIGMGGVSQTPDVDVLLALFVDMDYLMKDKDQEVRTMTASTQSEDTGFIYSMGPRAAMEIGRRQLVCFCAEILDEESDPTMLAEIDDGNEEEEEHALPLEVQ